MNLKDIQLSELTLENIDQWPPVIKSIAIAILSVLIIFLGYWLIVKANFEQYTNLKNTEKTLKVEFEQKQYQASNLQSYKNQLKIMQERFGKMLQQLPTKHEMPGLLEDISKTGIASGLTFERFAPEEEVEHDFYIELPIQIIVIGDYHQIAIFLSRVAEMDRIVTIHDFLIEWPTKETQQGNKYTKLRMKLTAKIYRYQS